MFEFLKKKKKTTALDAFIHSAYGEHPPTKFANTTEASLLASNDLLGHKINLVAVTVTTIELSKGPIPYSTHDLAVSVALGFLKQRGLIMQLGEIQLVARDIVKRWAIEGKVVGSLAQSFEKTLANIYGDSLPSETDFPNPDSRNSEGFDDNQLPVAAIVLRKQLRMKSPQEAARSVIACMTWQYDIAMVDRGFNDEDDEDDEEAEKLLSHNMDIERAFLWGCGSAAFIAFSVSEEKKDIFWLNVVGGYAGISDQNKFDIAFAEIAHAVDDHQDAYEAGSMVMYSYLMFGKQEIDSTKFSSLIH